MVCPCCFTAVPQAVAGAQHQELAARDGGTHAAGTPEPEPEPAPCA